MMINLSAGLLHQKVNWQYSLYVRCISVRDFLRPVLLLVVLFSIPLPSPYAEDTQIKILDRPQYSDDSVVARFARDFITQISSSAPGLVRQAGESLNQNGRPGDVLTGAGKGAATNALMNVALPQDKDEPSDVSKTFLGTLQQRLMRVGQDAGVGLVRDSLSTGGASSGNVSGNIGRASTRAVVDTTVEAARATRLPFLANMETEYTLDKTGLPTFSLITVQPLYESKDYSHNVFMQFSGLRADHRTNINGGLAYRYLTPSKNLLIGPNAFIDYQTTEHHLRSSLGFDARTRYAGLGFNRYYGLTGWKDTGGGFQEKAMSGYDVELSGEVPELLPGLRLFVKQYEWYAKQGESPHGFTYSGEYTPFPLLTIKSGWDNGSDEKTSYSVGVAVSMKVGVPLREQLKPITAAQSTLENYRFTKVRRENAIKVERRVNPLLLSNVIETVGANTFAFDSTVGLLSLGQAIDPGTSITVSSAGGSYLKLRFGDGGILTIAAGSVVEIQQEQIVLNSGAMNYVSGAYSRNVNTPGGTIKLLGTDIDVTNSGSSSVVRVRDGSVQLASSATTITVASGETASFGLAPPQVLVSTDAIVSATGLEIFQKISKVSSPVDLVKASPYIVSAPHIVSVSPSVGQNVILGVTFSKAVNVNPSDAPALFLTVNGVSRTAVYQGGTGNAELQFAYTFVSGDFSAATLSVLQMSTSGEVASTDGHQPRVIRDFNPVTLSLPTSVGGITTPGSISFTAVTGAATNTLVTSAQSTVTGITVALPISVSGDGTPQFQVNSGTWVTSGMVQLGDTLRVRLFSASAEATVAQATLSISGTTVPFVVTTGDFTPDTISFTTVTGAATNTVVASAPVTLAGIDVPVSVSTVSSSVSPQVRINGGAWGTSGTISNGQTLEARLTTGATASVSYTAQVNVGTVQTSFTVVTQTPAGACGGYDVTLGPLTDYINGQYGAYFNPFNIGSHTRPAEWDISGTIHSSGFPDCTNLYFTMPAGTPPTVWGYLFMDFGNYQAGPVTNITPHRINELTQFTEHFDWTYTGSSNFNLLSEHWLTNVPGDFNTIKAEIGFYFHGPASTVSFHNSGSNLGNWTDPSGRTWSVRKHSTFITFYAGTDVLSGTLDRKSALDWLVTQGQISSTWWVNGTGFGAEPIADTVSRSTVLTTNHWSIDWAGTSPGDNAAQDLFARMTTPPAASMQTAISNFVNSLISAGVWERLDGLYLPRYLGALDMHRSLLGAPNDAVARAGTPTFVAGQGVSFHGNSYWGTNFNPSTANGNWQQDSLFLAVRNEADVGTSSTQFLGVSNGFLGRNTAGTSGSGRMNDGTTTFFGGAPGTNLFQIYRSVSSSYIPWFGSTAQTTVNVSSTGISNEEVLIGRAGTGTITSATMSIAAFGGALTTQQRTAFVAAETALRNAANAAGY